MSTQCFFRQCFVARISYSTLQFQSKILDSEIKNTAPMLNSVRSVLVRFTQRSESRLLRHASTHFGYQQVDESEKTEKVKTVFANVATKYDFMNDAMSMGIHRLWKDYYVSRVSIHKNSEVLDVAGGTGDIAFRILKEMPNASSKITLVDINENMIDVGKLRAEDDKSLDLNRLKWICADAENLPLESDAFDLYTISFGIRNCTHVDKVLKEAYRVLRPGGKFTCLEFSEVNSLLRPMYDLYSFQVIPMIGKLLVGDYDSYKYLVESIRMFPNQEKFAAMIGEAGFTDVTYENLSGGICAIHTGRKI